MGEDKIMKKKKIVKKIAKKIVVTKKKTMLQKPKKVAKQVKKTIKVLVKKVKTEKPVEIKITSVPDVTTTDTIEEVIASNSTIEVIGYHPVTGLRHLRDTIKGITYYEE